jgi:hypothetical protein
LQKLLVAEIEKDLYDVTFSLVERFSLIPALSGLLKIVWPIELDFMILIFLVRTTIGGFINPIK